MLKLSLTYRHPFRKYLSYFALKITHFSYQWEKLPKFTLRKWNCSLHSISVCEFVLVSFWRSSAHQQHSIHEAQTRMARAVAKEIGSFRSYTAIQLLKNLIWNHSFKLLVTCRTGFANSRKQTRQRKIKLNLFQKV